MRHAVDSEFEQFLTEVWGGLGGTGGGGTYGPPTTERAMLLAAIGRGVTSENALTDLLFHRRHPARNRRPIARGEPGFAALSREWLGIRNGLVRPALRRSSAAPRPGRPVPTPGGGGTAPAAPETVLVRGIRVARRIAPQVAGLLAAADAAGISLTGGGFRTGPEQIELRRQHCGNTPYDIYEKPANQCDPPTAKPGTSNHEKGLAIDFRHNGAKIKSRENPGFRWLAANAARFGLCNLPSEPWHWSVDGR